MGGSGSGHHWHAGAKDTTDDYRSIDVRRWHREGLLSPFQSFRCYWTRNGEEVASINVRTEQGRLFLSYRHRSHGGEWEDEAYPVRLDWTACNYGGKRPWFLCPAKGCGKRVALHYGGAIFACRHCHQLAYPSQREERFDRAARRADKIRARLGWEQGILNPKGWKKPKGMHWRTFDRLNAEHDADVDEALAGIADRLGWLRQSILG